MSESKTIQFLEERLRANPKSLLFAILADIYLQEGRLEDAVVLCSEGVQANPDYITGRYILAKAYSMQGENEKAENELKQILSHDRHHLAAHKMMADTMIRMGWENNAVIHYKEILKSDPLCDEIRDTLNTLSISEEVLKDETRPESASRQRSQNRKTYIGATPKREISTDQDDWLDQLLDKEKDDSKADLDQPKPVDHTETEPAALSSNAESSPKSDIVFETEQGIILDPVLEEAMETVQEKIENKEETDIDMAAGSDFISESAALPEIPVLSDDTPLSDTDSYSVPQNLTPEELERALDELLDTSDLPADSTEIQRENKTDKDAAAVSAVSAESDVSDEDEDLDRIFDTPVATDSPQKTANIDDINIDDLNLDDLEAALDGILLPEESSLEQKGDAAPSADLSAPEPAAETELPQPAFPDSSQLESAAMPEIIEPADLSDTENKTPIPEPLSETDPSIQQADIESSGEPAEMPSHEQDVLPPLPDLENLDLTDFSSSAEETQPEPQGDGSAETSVPLPPLPSDEDSPGIPEPIAAPLVPESEPEQIAAESQDAANLPDEPVEMTSTDALPSEADPIENFPAQDDSQPLPELPDLNLSDGPPPLTQPSVQQSDDTESSVPAGDDNSGEAQSIPSDFSSDIDGILDKSLAGGIAGKSTLDDIVGQMFNKTDVSESTAAPEDTAETNHAAAQTEPKPAEADPNSDNQVDLEKILDNIMANQDIQQTGDDDFAPDTAEETAREAEPEQAAALNTSPEALESNPLFVDKASEENAASADETARPPAPEPHPEDAQLEDPPVSDFQGFDLTPPPPETNTGFPKPPPPPESGIETNNDESGTVDMKESKLVSPTLGEIYAAQGEYEKAIKVYETLMEKHPDDSSYADKIRELKKKLEDKNTE